MSAITKESGVMKCRNWHLQRCGTVTRLGPCAETAPGTGDKEDDRAASGAGRESRFGDQDALFAACIEVRVGSDILYTDEKAKYLFVGRILDTKTYQDYTKARVDEMSKIKFSDLPLASAMKVVKGNGKRVIAVFEDPNCGYCKRFDKTLQEMDNVTVYTFLYNILSEDSGGQIARHLV